MSDQKQIDDLVSMLDSFMENGGGHMNITVDNQGQSEQIYVETYKSSDCGTNSANSACRVPTLQEGMDEE